MLISMKEALEHPEQVTGLCVATRELSLFRRNLTRLRNLEQLEIFALGLRKLPASSNSSSGSFLNPS